VTVAEMHSLYVQKHEVGTEDPVVPYSFYLKYIKENFNLSLGYPKTDTCDSLQIQLMNHRKLLCASKKKIT